MKRLTMNLMTAAAALMITAGVASAQMMKADIPFSFKLGGATLAPGTYRLHLDGQSNLVSLENGAHHYVAMGLASSRIERDENVTPKLIFDCSGDRCYLAQAWTGPSRDGYRFNVPARRGILVGRVVEISLKPVNGE